MAVDVVVDMMVVVEAGKVMMGDVAVEVGMMVDAVGMMVVVEVGEGTMEDAVAEGATVTKVVAMTIVPLTEMLDFLLADPAQCLHLLELRLSWVVKASYHPVLAVLEPAVVPDHRGKF